VIAGTLALICLIASVVAVWAQNTVFDSERVANAVGDALDEPEVTDALATRITDEVMSAVGFEQYVEGVLPQQLAPLAPALTGGVTSVVENRISNRLAEPQVQALIVQLVERAHAEFVDVLKGDGLVDGVTVNDGAVTVNALPIVTDGLEAVQRLGFLSNVEIPELTRDGDPEDQIAQLSDALGRDLPPGFGQVEVYRSDRLADAGATLERAQQALVFFQRAIYVLIGLTIVLTVASIVLANRRIRAALVLAGAAAVSLIVVRAVVNRVLDETPNMFVKPGARKAIEVTTRDLASQLLAWTAILAVLGLVLAILLALFDSQGSLRKKVGERTGDDSLRATAFAYRGWIAGVSIAAALVLVSVAGFGWVTGLLAVVLLVVAIAAWFSGPDLTTA
jgi:hypothetical protein